MNGPFSLDPTFCARLALAMVHFLWQGLVVTALACAAARWLREASPGSRHRVYAAALALMLACFPGTLGLLYLLDDARPATLGAKDRPGMDANSASGLNVAAGRHSTIAADPVARFRVSETSGVIWTVPRLARWTAAGYLVGICIMFGRMMLALRGGWRLRRDALPLDDPALLAAVKRLVERLGLSAAPVVAYCDRVAVPAVVGVLRPAILLPVTLATGLTPEQVHLVIAHEMAHIRRWDHLMMLAQWIAESVLFFHPAVWYLSHRLSVERELCCDSLVVTSGARPSDYAETLLRVMESCRRPEHGLPEAALAMTPGRGRSAALVHRVTCILGQRSSSPVRLGRWWSIGLASTIVLATALGVRLGVRAESADASALEPAEAAAQDVADAPDVVAPSEVTQVTSAPNAGLRLLDDHRAVLSDIKDPEIRVRYLERAAQVADATYESLAQANRRNPGAVPQSEMDRARLERDVWKLYAEQAVTDLKRAEGHLSAEDARMVRLITSHELTKAHWAALEAEEFLPTIDALWNDLVEESELGVSWTARFLRSTSGRKPPLTLTDFEKEALARIDRGAAEVFRRSDTGVIRYVRPIRPQRSCATLCHPELRGVMDTPRDLRSFPRTTEGDLRGILSIEITPKQEPTPPVDEE